MGNLSRPCGRLRRRRPASLRACARSLGAPARKTDGPRRSRGNSTPGGAQQPSSFDTTCNTTAFGSRREAAPAFGSADDNRYLPRRRGAGGRAAPAAGRRGLRGAARASPSAARPPPPPRRSSSASSRSCWTAFSYFSHLLNITEDVGELRRQRAAGREGAAPAHGSIAAALAGLEAAGAQPDEVRAWLGAMTISPVLTAHPTEVQRKSIQDCEREVSRLLQVRSFAAIEIGAPSAALEEAAAGAVAGAKASAGGVIGSSSAVSLASMALVAEDGAASAGTGASAGTHAPPLAPAPAPAPAPTVLCALTGEELADAEARLFRHMITLWQTAMLRLTKLKVTDEVNNAIEFHAITFLVVVPRLNASPPAAAALPTNGAAASAVPPPPVAADALTPCPPLTDVGHAAMSTRRCGGYLCQR